MGVTTLSLPCDGTRFKRQYMLILASCLEEKGEVAARRIIDTTESNKSYRLFLSRTVVLLFDLNVYFY